MPRLTNLFIQPKLSFECRVEKTKCPVNEALTAISAVSLSLISPIIKISGSCLNKDLKIVAKFKPNSFLH